MDDDLHAAVRVEAAKAGKSVSRYLAQAAREKLDHDEAIGSNTKKQRQIEALERIFNGPKWNLTENGRMPTAEERNARR
ncbi:MAG: hypothetical protein ACTHJ3_10055 [Pararhizobium sp.]